MPEEGYGFIFGAGKEFRVAEWSALNHFAWAFVVAGESCVGGQIGAAFDQKLGDR